MASRNRWLSRRRVRGPAFFVSLCVLVLGPGADTGAAAQSDSGEDAALRPAEADSARIARFRGLPEASRQDRMQQARRLRDDAQETDDGPRRLQLLADAAEADPADPQTWLDLAQVQKWMGYPDRARLSLASARFAMSDLSGKEKNRLLDRYCLDRAWLEYEEANWAEGEKWANYAVKRDVGLSAQLIAGLNRAARVYTEPQMRESLKAFRPFDRNTNRPANFEWIYRLWMHLHGVPWVPPDVWDYTEPRVKVPEHNLTRWRDFGMLFEIYEEGDLAVRFYRKSVDSLPVRDGGWLREAAGEIPGARSSLPAMPFWTNPDDGYVTGSILAYQTHCYRMMEQATDPGQRTRWAELVVRAGKAAVHRYPKRPWTRLWRGKAFLALDMFKEAEEDITYAVSWFEEFGIVEPLLNPVYGHILLRDKNYREALPVLEQAAADFPTDGAVWADLGVARVMSVGRDPAREAFDRAIALDPELAVAWRNRGLVNLRDGRFEEAVSDLEAAAELVPGDPQITSELARARQLRDGR